MCCLPTNGTISRDPEAISPPPAKFSCGAADTTTVVPTKSKRAARRQAVQAKAPATPTTTIVVRRGALKRFDTMKRKTAGLPVNLVWDRRVGGERRADANGTDGERRKIDRRQQPPFTWSLADFVVVDPAERDGSAGTPPGKKAKKR